MLLIRWWKNLSIAKKLYLTFGIMAILIAIELLTLRFAMHTLSAVRAFVAGEGIWSKAQKNALLSLQNYAAFNNPADYQKFHEYLKIPEGDHEARIELLRPTPDFSKIEKGFTQGGIHKDDIPPMVELIRRFYWISYIATSIEVWTKADDLLYQIRTLGIEFYESKDKEKRKKIMTLIQKLNIELTALEEIFSNSLGEGSRWLENVIITLLILAVLTVEGIGLTLTFLTSRSISIGLSKVIFAFEEIGKGNFSVSVNAVSNDEIGKLSSEVNKMSSLLRNQYLELENRVADRTKQLSDMAQENEKLYNKTKNSLRAREEFLSIASHELKTPLTALLMQVQLLDNSISQKKAPLNIVRIQELSQRCIYQTKQLAALIDQLLDLTRINVGKFEIHLVAGDLTALIQDMVMTVQEEAKKAGCSILLDSEPLVLADFDPIRMRQVIANLLSNAIKYGKGKPIQVVLGTSKNTAFISVTDQGEGIAVEDQQRIFEQFERVNSQAHDIVGLGLGLYITKQIVEAHGGKIVVKSEIGKGATFTVDSIPIC